MNNNMTLLEYINYNEIELNSHQRITLEKSNVLNMPIKYIMDFFNTEEIDSVGIIISNPKYYYKLGVIGSRYHEDIKKLIKK